MIRTALLVVLAAGLAQAQSEGATPEVRVERQKLEKARSLEFLHENQIFLRAQLDRLRTRTQWREHDARELTARQEWLRGLGRDLSASVDSLARERTVLEGRQLVERIEELAEIEMQLDRMESLIQEQGDRLQALEADYVGRQETALAVLATGLPFDDATMILVHTLDGDPVRVHLDDDARAVLQHGAIATLVHDFVEPRTHALRVEIVRRDGTVEDLGSFEVETARDRLNFVQIALDRRDEAGQLEMVTWSR